MVKSKDIIADLHTHTIFSKHAFSTLQENIAFAPENIRYMAVTDHFYYKADSTEWLGKDINVKNEMIRMYDISRVNAVEPDINLIPGVELNVGQSIGTDISRSRTKKNVPWRLIGVHSWFIPNDLCLLDVLNYYEYAVNSITVDKDTRYIKPTAFAHPERGITIFKNVDETWKEYLTKLVDLAVANNCYLELNESSFVNDHEGNIERLEFWVKYAISKNAQFCLGSDAHYCKVVGRFDNVLNIINKYNIPESNILNHACNENKLKKFVL